MLHITTISLAIFTVIYTIVSIIMLFIRKPDVGYGVGIMLLILGVITYSIMTVDNECIITGPCLIWGWIRFALICLFIILPSIITSILIMADRSKEEQ